MKLKNTVCIVLRRKVWKLKSYTKVDFREELITEVKNRDGRDGIIQEQWKVLKIIT